MDNSELLSRIHRDYSYPRDKTKPLRFEKVREAVKQCALLFVENLPPSRELHTALLKLEEAAMHAHAAIAREYPDPHGAEAPPEGLV